MTGDLPSPFAGRYEVVRLLGSGGMGRVYEVVDRELSVRVALKVLGDAEDSDDAVRRLRDEVRLARRITHPNVVRIFDIAEARGVRYFTMELVAGETLLELADREGTLAPARLIDIGLQIARGLDAAHVAGVAHRDLKPSNVLLGRDGRVVLTDFGVARATGSRSNDPSGTPGFMAPEQERGEDSGPSCDLYSFGLLMRWLRPPPAADAPTTPGLGAGAPSLSRLLAQCLALDPSARPSAHQVAFAFEVAAGGAPAAATPARIEEPATEPSVRAANESLAVLPLKAGAGVDGELAEALTSELVDALTRNPGLKVISAGAAARFAEDRDPKRVGRELGASTVVDASLKRSGDRLRIDARLIEAATGVQLWMQRFEEELDGVLQLQEAMAVRIAEALRVGIGAVANRGSAPGAAIESYLRARAAMHRYQLGGPEGASALFEECLRRAPDFLPAIAAVAHCRVREWYVAPPESSAALQAVAKQAVERCIAAAPELPESHVASGIYRMQLGDYAQAVSELSRALVAAPTSAEAHELLAQLELEAGRRKAGLSRARLALQLDPHSANARMQLHLRDQMTGGGGAVESAAGHGDRSDAGRAAARGDVARARGRGARGPRGAAQLAEQPPGVREVRSGEPGADRGRRGRAQLGADRRRHDAAPARVRASAAGRSAVRERRLHRGGGPPGQRRGAAAARPRLARALPGAHGAARRPGVRGGSAHGAGARRGRVAVGGRCDLSRAARDCRAPWG